MSTADDARGGGPATPSGSTATLLALASTSLATGALDMAIAYATRAVDLDSACAGGYLVRGVTRRLRNSADGAELARAAQDFARLVALDPANAEGQRLLGNTSTLLAAQAAGAERDELLAQARQAFLRASRLNPASFNALLDVAEADLCSHRYREAAAWAAQASRRISGGHLRVAIWLAGLANALLGREGVACRSLERLRDTAMPPAHRGIWVTTEVEAYLTALSTDSPVVPQHRLDLARTIHAEFLRGYLPSANSSR